MFFPKLTRREVEKYYSNRGTFYANYGDNYEMVAQDCLERCVYCDVTILESGGDKMCLDHFRPQNHFSVLSTHPHNLHLACPKCNGLKKDDWPAAKIVGQPSYVGATGYIDRFQVDILQFLSVNEDGTIVSISHPADYMIKKLHLNRTSRLNVRRKRYLDARKTELLKEISNLMKSIAADRLSGRLSDKEAFAKYDRVGEIFAQVQLLP